MEDQVRMSVTTRVARIGINDTGVIVVEIDKGARVTKDDAREITDGCFTVSPDRKRPLMVDISKVVAADKGARDWFAESSRRKTAASAVAMVINSPVGKILGNFYLMFSRPVIPTRLFTDQQSALQWLSTWQAEPTHHA